MKQYVPYEKRSKKEKRKADATRRGSWGDVKPVTRKVRSAKVYDRKKIRNLEREPYGSPNSGSLFYFVPRFL